MDETGSPKIEVTYPHNLTRLHPNPHKSLAKVILSLVEFLERIVPAPGGPRTDAESTLNESFEKLEADVLKIAIVHAAGNPEIAASLLGIETNTLANKLREHGIEKSSLELAVACFINGELDSASRWY